VRESKEKKKSSFFFWLSDFYLFFTISRKFKSIIKGIGKKGKFKSCISPIFTTTRSTRIVCDCGVSG
jgi:hypothetical protein